MRTYKRIKLVNFLSTGKKGIELDLTKKGIRSIIGRNLDVSATASNGAGKTTILQGIHYALFGVGIESSIKQDHYVNWKNGKGMVVEIEFEQDGHTYIITRKRKPNSIKIIMDGKDITPKKDPDKLIQSIIKTTPERYQNSELLTAKSSSYMDMTPAKQRDFIERLFGLDALKEKAERLKAIKKNLSTEISYLDGQLVTAVSTNQNIQENIENLKKKRNNIDLDRVKKALEELESMDLESMLEERNKIDESIRRLTDVKREGRTKKSDYQRLVSELKKLESGICPRCEQSWTNEQEIERLKQEIKSLKKELIALKAEKERLEEEIHTDLPERHEIERLIRKREAARARLSSNPEEMIAEQIKRLKSQLVDTDELTKQKETLETKLKHCEMLIKLLTNSKSPLRKRIIEVFVPYLNVKINEYLTKLESQHRLEIKPDLSSEIKIKRTKAPYSNLSTGQKTRINIAILFAIRDFVVSFGGDSDLLMIDEIFDGADVDLIENVFGILREKGLSVLLISHRDKINEMVDDTITVVLEGGFSRVEG